MKTLLLASALLLAALVWASWPASTPPITGAGGEPLPGGIATLEPVRIGGMQQWLLIRGRDTANPVLLWLHGGPGAAEMPVVPHYVGSLEREFVVVHWDQRGAGKSNPRGFDESTMTFERFVEDAHELTGLLKGRLGKDRIYLLGHSWGSQLGLVLARQFPEDYVAYVAVGQFVSAVRSQRVARDWLAERMRVAGDEDALRRLGALGRPPAVPRP